MKCPNMKSIDDIDWCELEDHLCVLMGTSECSEWEEIKKEEQNNELAE